VKTFFDTSAFAKRYINEPGSRTVAEICTNSDDIAICIVAVTECFSTFNRLRREKRLAHSSYIHIKEELLKDIADISLILLSPSIVHRSILALEMSPLRAIDALHIACASYWQPDVFVSSDTQQIRAAQRMGLRTRTV
jgi:predicted nucleic acid-binding protein